MFKEGAKGGRLGHEPRKERRQAGKQRKPALPRRTCTEAKEERRVAEMEKHQRRKDTGGEDG